MSRVGGNAQIKAMRKVAGGLRLDLSQYRDLEAFAAFGSDLDAASRAQLDRGARLVELLKQPQYSPFPVEREVVSVWAGTTGQLDDVPVEDIRRFEAEFLDRLQRAHAGIYDAIRETGSCPRTPITALKDAIDEFKRSFETTRASCWSTRSPVEAVDEDEVEQDEAQEARAAAEEGGRELDGSAAARGPAADQDGPVHREDHQGAGAHRLLADRQGAAAGAEAVPYTRELTARSRPWSAGRRRSTIR